MSRPKVLRDAGVRKSTADLAARLSRAVASQHYRDKWNSDALIKDFDPLETLARIAANPKVIEQQPAISVSACKEIARYLYEPRKPIEPVAAQAQQVIVNGAVPGAWVAQDFGGALPAPSKRMQPAEEDAE